MNKNGLAENSHLISEMVWTNTENDRLQVCVSNGKLVGSKSQNKARSTTCDVLSSPVWSILSKSFCRPASRKLLSILKWHDWELFGVYNIVIWSYLAPHNLKHLIFYYMFSSSQFKEENSMFILKCLYQKSLMFKQTSIENRNTFIFNYCPDHCSRNIDYFQFLYEYSILIGYIDWWCPHLLPENKDRRHVILNRVPYDIARFFQVCE